MKICIEKNCYVKRLYVCRKVRSFLYKRIEAAKAWVLTLPLVGYETVDMFLNGFVLRWLRFFYSYYLLVCMCAGVHRPQHAYGSQRITFRCGDQASSLGHPGWQQMH